MDSPTSAFPPGALLTLKVCAVIIVLGMAILAYDRWVVRADQPDAASQRQTLADEQSLLEVSDAATLARLQQRLQAFGELVGRLEQIEHAYEQPQANARLWLVEFTISERSLVQTNVRARHVVVTQLAILLELNEDPGWPSFLQTDDSPAPPLLPAEYAERLAQMTEYRMAIDGRWLAFISQPAFEPLLQAIQANQSSDFHPGLLNSALRIDVQRALDISAALPGAPELERFYRIDVDVQIDAPSVSAFSEKMRADRERIAAEQAAAREQFRLDMEQQRAEFRRRSEENLARFRQRNAENLERARSGVAASDTQPDAGDVEPAVEVERTPSTDPTGGG